MSTRNPAALTGVLRARPDLLITADFNETELARLRELGTVRLLGWAAGEWFASAGDLKRALESVDVLVAGYEPVTAELMDASPRLRLIASIRSEPRANVDVDAATGRGIPVLHTVGRTNHSVAEFTVAALLAMTRSIVPAVTWMRERPEGFELAEPFYRETVWGGPGHAPQLRFTGIELHGRTIGLVGLGSIGRAVVQKLSGFGMRVLAHDPYVSDSAIEDLGVEPVTLDALLARSDAISLHARLTPASRGLIGVDQLARMKPGAWLINTARSGLIDRTALIDALDSGRLRGAALDVFDREPPDPDDPLVRHPLVLPTPHIAAWTAEVTDHHSRSLVDELMRIAAGSAPVQIANPEVLSG